MKAGVAWQELDTEGGSVCGSRGHSATTGACYRDRVRREGMKYTLVAQIPLSSILLLILHWLNTIDNGA